MDKNKKIKQQSFEYNNKNTGTKSNQLINKSYMSVKDITFSISFHCILAKKKKVM